MTEADSLLVRVLARADVLRLPIRSWSRFVSANRFLGLERLAAGGVPLRMNARGDEARRKQGERDLIDLGARGLVHYRRTKEKFPLVRLTPAGESRARALCGLPDRAAGRRLLAAVADGTRRDPKQMQHLWLAETALNGGKGWGLDAPRADRAGLARVELEFLPAASAGWLAAHSSVEGHAYYRVTAAGWVEVDTPAPAPAVGALPEPDPDACDLYESERDAALIGLEQQAPARTGEIGAGPLPVAMHWLAVAAGN
jgi:hypothetical protein